MLEIEIFEISSRWKFPIVLRALRLHIRTQKWQIAKNQVSTTSWVFEYSIMYCKNSKTQKTEEKVKTKDIFQFHSCLKNKK